MKLQFQYTAFFPSIGGVETYLDNVSRILSNLGHEPTILCSKHLPDLSDEEVYRGVKVIRHPSYYLSFPASLIGPFYYVKKLQKFIKEKGIEADVILTRHPYYCYASCSESIAPVIYIPPSLKSLENKNSMIRRGVPAKLWGALRDLEIDFIEHKAVHGCDGIVVFSELMKCLIATYHRVPGKKIRVIPPGVDLQRFRPRKRDTSLLRELRIPKGSKIVLTVCRLSPLKRVDVLIDSFSKIREKNVHLIVVGDGRDRRYLENLASNLHLGSRVRFVGFRRDVERFYSVADVFVLPSICESFGHVLLEAMSSGVPVIGFKRKHPNVLTACNEVIKNGETGYSIKFDVYELAAKINEIIGNEKLNEEMGRRARELCEKEYSWEKHVESLLDYIS